LGLTAWVDPHNSDPRFTRVRLRTEVLPLLEQVLGGGVAEALARTASALREDTDALDSLAAQGLAAARSGDGLEVAAIIDLTPGLRRRVIRAWLLTGGATGLTDTQIRAVDALVTRWRGQGGVAVGSGVPYTRLFAERRGATLLLRHKPV
jgi:tRNA(Ile)-lysidine synthase